MLLTQMPFSPVRRAKNKIQRIFRKPPSAAAAAPAAAFVPKQNNTIDNSWIPKSYSPKITRNMARAALAGKHSTIDGFQEYTHSNIQRMTSPGARAYREAMRHAVPSGGRFDDGMKKFSETYASPAAASYPRNQQGLVQATSKLQREVAALRESLSACEKSRALAEKTSRANLNGARNRLKALQNALNAHVRTHVSARKTPNAGVYTGATQQQIADMFNYHIARA